MMFDKLCVDKIIKREKTVTRRLINLGSPKRPARPGSIHKLKIDRTKKTFGDILILSCTQEQIKNIDDEEAIKEGFESRKEYIDYFMDVNKLEILNDEDWVWRVEFAFIEDELDLERQECIQSVPQRFREDAYDCLEYCEDFKTLNKAWCYFLDDILQEMTKSEKEEYGFC